MNSGIYYLYEYKNDQRLRTVGFLKLSCKPTASVLQLQARRIPVTAQNTTTLSAFFIKNGTAVSKNIATLPCGTHAISAQLSVPDDTFSGFCDIQQLHGFLILLPDGTRLAALASNVSFDTRYVRDYQENAAKESRSNSNKTTAEEPTPDSNETTAEESNPHSNETTAEESIFRSGRTTSEELIPETAPTEVDSPVNISSESTPSEDDSPEVISSESTPSEDDSPEVISSESTPSEDDSPEVISSESTPSETDSPGVDSPEIDSTGNDSAKADSTEYTVHESSAQADETSANAMPKRTIRKIRRSDLSILPRKCWNLANNSFLLHGYHNYKHLLLIEEDGHYWVGVPGIYDIREARAAELLGFPQFTDSYNAELSLTSDEQNPQGRFGYWCHYIP